MLKKLLLTVLLILSILVSMGVMVSEVSAMWAKMSDQELVKHSDLIVIGELVSLSSEGNDPFDLGTIRIEEVILGKKGIEDVKLAVPSRKGLRISTSILYRIGQRGLWFLRLQPEAGSDRYLADHPQRLQPEENVSIVRKHIYSNLIP